MTESDRIKYLRVALFIVGLIFTFGIWPLTIVWQSGWAWHAGGRAEYLEMIFGVYASFVHGAIMAVQSIADTRHIGHLWGDAPALILVGAVLAALMPRRVTAGSSPSAA
jgi:Family of unknown function (DUF6632)